MQSYFTRVQEQEYVHRNEENKPCLRLTFKTERRPPAKHTVWWFDTEECNSGRLRKMQKEKHDLSCVWK